jgi:hypothetical protein
MLNFRLFIRVFLQIVLSAIGLTSSLAAAQTQEFDDVFAYGGDMCHTHNPAVRKIRRIEGSLKNISDTNTFNVACPIITKFHQRADVPGARAHPLVDIRVRIDYFYPASARYAPFAASICVFSRNIGLTTLPGETSEKVRVQASLPESSGTGSFSSVEHTFEDVSRFPLASPLYVSCTLPPLAEIRLISVRHSVSEP